MDPTAARGQQGFSLIETMIALGILATGLLGAAAIMTTGMQRLAGSPAQVIATQKAAEAIESVFAARDSHVLTWAQIRNVKGASGADGGVFLDGPQPLKLPGPDGLVNTADDGALETVTNPGPDGVMGTADDQVVPLSG
ncbi:MAG TPA: prepilin-type N-terminal cleavage/methylation domain-containing protein, partial [Vicinamibacterales bacterium]|nr:prepilin-type N-terminal cleavage/methylation domain-containing protein [Vicinamibacterales bacterium]